MRARCSSTTPGTCLCSSGPPRSTTWSLTSSATGTSPSKVLVTGRHDDGFSLHEIADSHRSLADADQRPVTAVVGQPGRASDAGRREATSGAELPRARPPQPADRLRDVLRGAQAGGALVEVAAEQLRIGQALALSLLDGLEDAAVEVG